MNRRIGKYLSVERLERPNGRKTDQWRVLTNHGDELGRVQWFGRWRQYAFNPAPGTTFNRDCLMDLATFLSDINKRHKVIHAAAARDRGEHRHG